MRLTDGKGVEAALDSVGGSITGECLKSLAPRGKVVHMGYPAGTDLISTCSRARHSAMLGVCSCRWSRAKSSPCWKRTYPLEQAAEATRHLIEDRPYGKVVLTID